jgi:hypothetical protein
MIHFILTLLQFTVAFLFRKQTEAAYMKYLLAASLSPER